MQKIVVNTTLLVFVYQKIPINNRKNLSLLQNICIEFSCISSLF